MQDIYIVSYCVLNTAPKTARGWDDAYRAMEMLAELLRERGLSLPFVPLREVSRCAA